MARPRRVLKSIVLIVVLVIVAILAIATTRPDTFAVQRSIDIDAPAGKVQAYLDDFHRWPEWSPWEKLDPSMQRTFAGPPRGKGAVYIWSGNSKAGAGRMEILDSSPSQVTIKLDFLKPFESHNTVEFKQPVTRGGGPHPVTWTMQGPSPYPAKLMGMFVSMDKMVGKDFETGLANLKAAAEK